MSDQTIRSSNENLDAVVRAFAADLDTFADTVSQKMGEVDSAMSRLANAWEGTLYDNFESSMRQKQAQIRGTVASARRLKERLDEIATQLAWEMEIMGQAGDDL